jgi:hypothetical protein
MSRVDQMVCPFCARMGGSVHASGCPGDGTKTHEYTAGWVSARDGLLAPFAERVTALRTGLEELLSIAERIHGGDPNLDPEEWYIARDYARVQLRR